MKNLPNKQRKKKKIVYQIPDYALPAYFKDRGFSDGEIKKLVFAATGKEVTLDTQKDKAE